MIASILILGLISVLLFRLARRHASNDLLAIAMTMVAMGASSVHWFARPHLFSLLFLVLCLHWVEESYANPGILWRFPVLTALWVNLHGAFFLGIIVLLTVAAGLALREMTRPEARTLREAARDAARRARPYIGAAVGCGAASFLNPYGWKLHQHIYAYLSERYHFENIQEFQTISFHAPVAKFFEVLVFLGLLACAWSIQRRRFVDALFLLSWMHLGLIAGRNIPIYAFLAVPVICRAVTEALETLRTARVAAWLQQLAASVSEFGMRFSQMDRIPRWHVASGLGAIVLFVVIVSAPVSAKKLHAEFDREKYPAAALELLDGRRVFTNDEWGDYLIYRLYPKFRVFVDGRSDFYGPEFCQRYLDIDAGYWNWESDLLEHRVDTILLRANSPFASTLKQSKAWRPVFDDKRAILFFRNDPLTGAERNGNAAFVAGFDEATPMCAQRRNLNLASKPNQKPLTGHLAD